MGSAFTSTMSFCVKVGYPFWRAIFVDRPRNHVSSRNSRLCRLVAAADVLKEERADCAEGVMVARGAAMGMVGPAIVVAVRSF